ncbi:hypothetical protein, partial, partial [Absidia glauca]
HLFDEVSIVVMQQNYQSAPFSPVTGVLQGSILSPHLYSIYINSLPQLLRPPDAPDVPETPSDLLVTFNCLLYADDVALIGTPATIRGLLHGCEQHSQQLGYRWNPAKSVIVNPTSATDSTTSYSLYDTPIPHATTFKYLGIPFTHGGKIDRDQLIRNNGLKTAQSMFTLSTLGLNSSGYAKLLSVRLYQQFLRPQMEYGLAITHLGKERMRRLEQVQDTCLRRIFGAHDKSSTKVMKHMARIPDMAEPDFKVLEVLHNGWNPRLSKRHADKVPMEI